MKIEAIKCDVCNGALEMEASGRTATCVVCGMRYSVERLQEKLCATQNFEGGINVGNIKISEDAEQLKTLLVKYLDSFDYNNDYILLTESLKLPPRMLKLTRSMISCKSLDILKSKTRFLLNIVEQVKI